VTSLARHWTFARHIPPRQMIARGWIKAKRLALPLFPISDAPLPVAAHPPLPLFPARTGMIAQGGAGWRFTFLHHAVTMPSAIDWRAAGEGQLWRMNLHYMEYLEEVDAAQGIALIESWIAANDGTAAKSWSDAWNSYALSIRVLCWMQFLARCEISDCPTIHRSLSRQLRALARFLETDLGGNHLVKNIKSLAWGSAFFEGSEAEQWRTTAIRLLTQELPRQILPDGVHYERSPAYHNQVLADVTETRAALGAVAALDDTIEKMARASSLLTHPDGLPAQYNDAGLTMAYRAKVLDAPAPEQGGFALPASGYFGFRSPTFYFVCKMGRIGADDLPAHAHADIGSFELSVEGQRMIVDQGVFEYIDGARRDQSRATAHHNCFTLGDRSQADLYGSFRCGARPAVDGLTFSISPTTLAVESRHDGYRPVTVTRGFAVSDTAILIRDRMSARTGEIARLFLLLHPECSFTLEGGTATVMRSNAMLTISGSGPVTSEPAVWWPDMGVEYPTTRLCLTLPPDCLESALEITINRHDAAELP
jgi:uncharacterized heparinase superfamily protein